MRFRPRPSRLRGAKLTATDTIITIIGLFCFPLSPILGGIVIFGGLAIADGIKRIYVDWYVENHNPYKAHRELIKQAEAEQNKTE